MNSYLFETARLRIRFWVGTDVSDAFLIYGDPIVQETLRVDARVVRDLSEMAQVLSKRIAEQDSWPQGKGSWAIELKETSRVIGSIVFRDQLDGDDQPTGEVEVAWHLGKNYWGQGYATEAAKACLKYGWLNNPKTRRVVAVMKPNHFRSRKVAERIGMKFVGISAQLHGVAVATYEITNAILEVMT